MCFKLHVHECMRPVHDITLGLVFFHWIYIYIYVCVCVCSVSDWTSELRKISAMSKMTLFPQDWDAVSEATYPDSLLFRHYASSSGKRRGKASHLHVLSHLRVGNAIIHAFTLTAELASYPWYFREPHRFSMGPPQISRVTLTGMWPLLIFSSDNYDLHIFSQQQPFG